MNSKIKGWIGASAIVMAACTILQGAYAGDTMTSGVDKKYLMDNAQGSVYDFATAELAVEKAHSTAVHNYGLMLLKDHARLNEMLLKLAHTRMLTLPVTLKSTDAAKINTLMVKSGTAFDMAYVREAVKINDDDVKQGQKELKVTKDPQVRAVVGDFVRTEQKHLSGAKALLAPMTKKG